MRREENSLRRAITPILLERGSYSAYEWLTAHLAVGYSRSLLNLAQVRRMIVAGLNDIMGDDLPRSIVNVILRSAATKDLPIGEREPEAIKHGRFFVGASCNTHPVWRRMIAPAPYDI